MVKTDKPLARLIVVPHFCVDKGQVLWSGILDTPLSLSVILLRKSLTQSERGALKRKEGTIKN